MAGRSNLKIKKTGKYYGVSIGRNPGICDDWQLCKAIVKGFPNGTQQGFKTFAEAVHHLNMLHMKNKDILVYSKAADTSEGLSIEEYCNISNTNIPNEIPPTTHTHNDLEVPTVYIDGACINNGQTYARGGCDVF